MRKKITLTVVAFVFLITSLYFVKNTNNTENNTETKDITINIVSDVDNVDKIEKISTNKHTMGEVLLNREGYKIENGMVLMLDNIDLSNSNNEYWSIEVNGERATVGVNDLIIKDGDIIKFERTRFR